MKEAEGVVPYLLASHLRLVGSCHILTGLEDSKCHLVTAIPFAMIGHYLLDAECNNKNESVMMRLTMPR